MAKIFAFPSDRAEPAVPSADVDRERFLLNEGLELLRDFRSIEDRATRDSLRQLVKSMVFASHRVADPRD